MANALEAIKIKFGKYKGRELKDIPDDYLKYLFDKGISKGKIKLYTQCKLKLPKPKFEVTVEDSVNAKDGKYIVEAYNSDNAINQCKRENNIQNSQSFHGTTYSVRLL